MTSSEDSEVQFFWELFCKYSRFSCFSLIKSAKVVFKLEVVAQVIKAVFGSHIYQKENLEWIEYQMKPICKIFSDMDVTFHDESNDSN